MHNLAASILSTATVPYALWSTVHAKPIISYAFVVIV